MAHTVTITIDDMVYKTLKPYIEQQTVDAFLAKIIGKNMPFDAGLHSCISNLRGTLHKIDTSDIREESDRIS